MSKKVTYAEIIEALSGKTGFSKQKSEDFAKALINRVKKELEENGKASITNFGSFKVKDVAERQGQNPQTGEPITIPAHKRVSFTPYKALKEEVNARYAHLETELIEEEEEKGSSVSLSQAEKPAPESEEPGVKADKKERSPSGSGVNTSLIMVGILTLVIVAIASIWFLMQPDSQERVPEQAAVEETQAPEEADQTVDETDTEDVAREAASEPESRPMQNMDTEDRDQVEEKAESTAETYTVQPNEWYWVISRKVYGKSHFWPLIYQASFTMETHPDSLEKGTALTIPSLEGSANNLTEGDYQKLSEASQMVSKAYQKFGRMDKAEEYARYAKKWGNLGK